MSWNWCFLPFTWYACICVRAGREGVHVMCWVHLPDIYLCVMEWMCLFYVLYVFYILFLPVRPKTIFMQDTTIKYLYYTYTVIVLIRSVIINIKVIRPLKHQAKIFSAASSCEWKYFKLLIFVLFVCRSGHTESSERFKPCINTTINNGVWKCTCW